MQILVRLHEDDALIVVGKSVLQQQVYQIGHKEDEEADKLPEQATVCILSYFFIVYIINNIEDTQYASQEHDGQSENQYPLIQ